MLQEDGQERFLGLSRVKHNVVFMLRCTNGASQLPPSPKRNTSLHFPPRTRPGGECSTVKGRLDGVQGKDKSVRI